MHHANDVVAQSWTHLIELLYDIPKTDFGRIRSDLIYRGVADRTWNLKTSLQRLEGPYEKLEGPILRSFRKYATLGSIPDGNKWVEISVAQHHGLPTRLLDWTSSPQVALHFATHELQHFDRDGAIWCLDVEAARDCLPPHLRKILSDNWADVFSVEMLEVVSTLRELDSILINHAPFVLIFEPPSLDARIVNQHAMFSVMPDSTMMLHDFLARNPHLYKRIIIPKEIKWEVRDKLDQDNVCERALFPGLDGLSTWLKRYYSPKA